EAVAALDAADWVVIGPGSWFTSVLPNLLVPGLRAALGRTSAKRILVLNLGEQKGETSGFSPENHLEVLASHAPELQLDYVLVDLVLHDGSKSLAAAAKALGAELIAADIAMAPGSAQHDPLRLASAFHQIMVQA
ncbi:MAG: gluconeogenesis factor YvcK family protein, partial [Aeromicrobium sp.]